MRSGKCITVATILALALPACTNTGSVSVTRLGRTGLDSGESIAIVLAQHQTCESDRKCSKPDSHASAERSASSCLANGIYPVIFDLRHVHAAQFRQVARMDTGDRDPGMPVSRVLALFEDPGMVARFAALGLRYVIVLTSSTAIGPGKFKWEGGNVSGMGGEWTRSSSMTAEILDMKARRQAGSLSVSSSGKAGFRVPFFTFIPLPLVIPYSSPTESESCHALGRSVGEFLLDSRQETDALRR